MSTSAERGSGRRDEAPPVPSPDRVATRARDPLAEEVAVGIDEPASEAMAARILEESEARVLDPAGTAEEHRHSEDTVDPQPT